MGWRGSSEGFLVGALVLVDAWSQRILLCFLVSLSL